MNRLRMYMQNQKQRRQTLALLSGGLIILALGADYLVGLTTLGNGLHLAATLVAGWDIAGRAWFSLRNRHASIELLVTIAAAGALVIGEYWEASAVTFLFILGAYLEARTLSRTRNVLRHLLDLAPTTAIVLRAGRQVEVPAREVALGEIVWLKPGAKIPVDGQVVSGSSAVDESAITGEPMPADKATSDPVYAGTVNQHGLLKVRATGVGADTTLAHIIRRIEEAQDEKAPTQRFIERFARWYTPAIIGLSALFFVFTRDVELALTLLVISCPGALVISTPVSVVAGIGRAAKSGILIKGGEYLENAGKISAVALDKTGTLTQGKPRLTEVIALQPAASLQPVAVGAGDNPPSAPGGLLPVEPGLTGWTAAQGDVLYWAALAEAGSEHPLARAIMAAWYDRQEAAVQTGLSPTPLPSPESFQAVPGKGVLATYQGQPIAVGTVEFTGELGISIDQDTRQRLEELKSTGRTAVVVAIAGQVAGLLGISDPIRPAAPALIRQLRQAGIRRITMLTGDDQLTAQAIAAEAGLTDVRAGLLPADKLAAIRALQAEGHVVAMAGDGFNDAPALAAADVGIAMGVAGNGLAIETAGIALMADDLLKIPAAIRLSKATLRNIRQNVIIALITVTLLIAGVLSGHIHMAGGMLVHQASVLLVILNGMRLLKA